LSMPITAVRGDDEDLNIEAWRHETTTFRSAVFPGDHFWLRQQPASFANELRRLAGLDGILQ
jgi:surfactin synthase thioesterase subunit